MRKRALPTATNPVPKSARSTNAQRDKGTQLDGYRVLHVNKSNLPFEATSLAQSL